MKLRFACSENTLKARFENTLVNLNNTLVKLCFAFSENTLKTRFKNTLVNLKNTLVKLRSAFSENTLKTRFENTLANLKKHAGETAFRLRREHLEKRALKNHAKKTLLCAR